MVDQAETRRGISIPEIAQRWGLSKSVLYRLAHAGKLPGCRRLGKRFVVHAEIFESWMASGSGDETENKS